MRHHLVALGIAVAAAVLTGLLTNEFHLRILFNIATYLLCAIGMNVLLGFAGQKSLGQAGLFAAGAYTAALLTTRYGVGPWLAFAAAAFIAALFGVMIAFASLRVRGPSLAMVTLAFGIVVEKLVTEASDLFGGAMGIYAIQPLTWAGVPLTMREWVWFAIALSLVAHILVANLVTGRFGRAFLALQADDIAAGSVGVSVYRYKVLAFVIAAVTCGLAGAMVAQQNQYINSDFISFNLSIYILLIVLFGGAGSLAGPLLGSVVLVILGAFLAKWSWIEHFVNGLLLLVALFVMPNGLMGALKRLLPARKAQQSAPSQPAPPPPDRSTPMSDEVVLELKTISKAYGGIKPARAISTTLKSGHIHALIGPNGAGKSTLLNIIAGNVQADSGDVLFRGQRLNGLSADAICSLGIARTFQNLRLFRDLSVIDNVLIGRHSRMKNGFLTSLLALPAAQQEEDKARAAAERILADLNLLEQAHLPAGSLPYGLQRRVELARALASDPVLLLLDEPAAGLNPQEAEELAHLLARIGQSGITILLIEHHMDVVMAISDHVIVLDYGSKIADGSVDTVQNDPKVIAAYLGEPVEGF